MVGIECLSKIKPICISKKLGLYLKNADDRYTKSEVKFMLFENYSENKNKDYHFRKKIIQSFNDLYYKGILKKDLSLLRRRFHAHCRCF